MSASLPKFQSYYLLHSKPPFRHQTGLDPYARLPPCAATERTLHLSLPILAKMTDTSDMKTEFKDELRENQEMGEDPEVSPGNPD